MSNSYTLHNGDCLDMMPTLAESSVDTIITDPPYGLSFMGKDWDHGVPGPRFWREALRVAKPGAMLLAFGGTRTFHRLAVAIEDAGWEIRDTLMWVYGSGFPKSHDISKAIDKAAGAEREVVGKKPNSFGRQRGGGAGWPEGITGAPINQHDFAITAPATDAARTWDGYGTALKPAWEPIILAMKPLDGTFAANALEHGVAGLWIDGGRVEAGKPIPAHHGTIWRAYGQPSKYKGDAGTVLNTSGRWPANLIHDGSDEVTGLFPMTRASGSRTRNNGAFGGQKNGDNCYGDWNPSQTNGYDDTGSAARFFYCAKASRSERNAGLEGMIGGKIPSPMQNHHPTVKPLALMRYLAKLTRTPSGGVVLDPFMGSGSTGAACMYEGRDFIGIEQDEEYTEIARRRIEHHRQEAVREQRQPALFEGMNGQQARIQDD